MKTVGYKFIIIFIFMHWIFYVFHFMLAQLNDKTVPFICSKVSFYTKAVCFWWKIPIYFGSPTETQVLPYVSLGEHIKKRAQRATNLMNFYSLSKMHNLGAYSGELWMCLVLKVWISVAKIVLKSNKNCICIIKRKLSIIIFTNNTFSVWHTNVLKKLVLLRKHVLSWILMFGRLV